VVTPSRLLDMDFTYTTNCIKNEVLPVNTVWAGAMVTTKGVKGFSASVLKDPFTPGEWADGFAELIKQTAKQDSEHNYIGGFLTHEDYVIVVSTKPKHRQKLIDAVKNILK
jgi:hypothetical protein